MQTSASASSSLRKSTSATAGCPTIGASWESFVIENALAIAGDHAEPYFYRTSAGAEIDLVLDWGGRGRWTIEIKRSRAPKLDRGFFEACEDLAPARRFLVYSGAERYPQQNGTEAISLLDLCREIQMHADA